MTRLKNGYGCHKKNIQITDIGNHIVAKVGLGKIKQQSLACLMKNTAFTPIDVRMELPLKKGCQCVQTSTPQCLH